MYREKTKESIRRKRIGVAATVVIIIALLIALWFAFQGAAANASEQGAASVRRTVLDTAMQCCAIEGSYPPSLKYLEEHYGLTINRDDYVVQYEAFAGNLPPTVVVKAR